VNVDLIQELGRRCADQRIATIDLDNTIIESAKQEALPTYEGGRGYQPVLAVWAEMDVIVADQFRDGNVSAQQEPLSVAREPSRRCLISSSKRRPNQAWRESRRRYRRITAA
jgi:hypothetical protein